MKRAKGRGGVECTLEKKKHWGPAEDGEDPWLGGTEGLTLTLCRLCGLS